MSVGERFGHVQEVIVQNFRAKPGTRMAASPEPALDELLWTAAVARLVLGPAWSIQAPPNLSYEEFPRLLDAGINDWGGVSPVTIDHVNPEAPWPEVERLRRRHRGARACAGPEARRSTRAYVAELDRWADQDVATFVRRRADAEGLARENAWHAGVAATSTSREPFPPGRLRRPAPWYQPSGEIVTGSCRFSDGSVTAGEGCARQGSRGRRPR